MSNVIKPRNFMPMKLNDFTVCFDVDDMKSHLILVCAADHIEVEVHVAAVDTRQAFEHDDLRCKKT